MNINKNNLLLGLLVSCLLALPMLAEEKDDSNKSQSPTTENSDQVRYGWFFGAGAGIGLERMQYNYWHVGTSQDILKKNNFLNYGVSLKVGGYVYLHPYVMVRSYLGYETIDPVGLGQSNTFLTNTTHYFPFYRTLTLNLDFIFNAYVSERLDVGFILGGGMDRILTKFVYRSDNINGSTLTSDPKAEHRFSEPHIKFGVRTMIDKKWGVELITKLPLFLHYTPIVINSNDEPLSTMGTISTTLNFVMEL